MINYKLILLIYSPVILMSLTLVLRDKFEPSNKSLKTCNWSLVTAIIVIGFVETNIIASAILNQIATIRNYQFNSLLSEIVSFISYCFVLILAFTLLRYVYKVSIVGVFQLRLKIFPFIFKIGGILLVVNVLSTYFLDLNIMAGPLMGELELIKSMRPKTFILFGFVTIILAPIVEEIVYRGLLYVPLHRKIGRYGAIIVSAIVWSFGHHFPSLSTIGGTFIIGLILGWLYDKNGSLLPPIIFHMFKNSWILVYYFR
jgi:membrane protease YdiL (CAAX protease family)